MAEQNNQFTFENPEYRKTYWHTCSHIMAQAVKRLWPEVKLAIGPSIDEGWYYDMDAPFAFTPDHLTQIEGEMRKICKEKLKLERFELPRPEALKFMEEKGEPFKVELINDLPEDAAISFYDFFYIVAVCKLFNLFVIFLIGFELSLFSARIVILLNSCCSLTINAPKTR